MDLNNYLELYAEKYVCESIYNNLDKIFKYNEQSNYKKHELVFFKKNMKNRQEDVENVKVEHNTYNMNIWLQIFGYFVNYGKLTNTFSIDVRIVRPNMDLFGNSIHSS